MSTKILSEAVFSLPEHNSDGEVNDDVHKDLEAALLENFEGFHTVLADSYRIDYLSGRLEHDESIVYSVVLTNTVSDLSKLKSLIKKFGGRIGVRTIYFKNPNGEVTYLEAESDE